MTNPYKPPISDVSDGNKDTRSKKKWKLFFWIILVLEVLSITSMFIDPAEQWFDILGEVLIYSVILTGLFGFSYDKKIFTRKLWGYIIPVGIIYDIYIISTTRWEDMGTTEELYFVIGFMIVVGLPIIIFQYLALYKYCFRSAEIWT